MVMQVLDMQHNVCLACKICNLMTSRTRLLSVTQEGMFQTMLQCNKFFSWSQIDTVVVCMDLAIQRSSCCQSFVLCVRMRYCTFCRLILFILLYVCCFRIGILSTSAIFQGNSLARRKSCAQHNVYALMCLAPGSAYRPRNTQVWMCDVV